MRAFFRNKPFEGEPIFRPGGSRALDSNPFDSNPRADHRWATLAPRSAADLNSLHQRRYGLPEQRPAASAPRTLAELNKLHAQHYQQRGGR